MFALAYRIFLNNTIISVNFIKKIRGKGFSMTVILLFLGNFQVRLRENKKDPIFGLQRDIMKKF